MIHRQSHDGHRLRDLVRRIERAADAVNPFLVVIAIGLAMLDISVFAALEWPRLPVH
ncbi:MAG TPA: hypothetical protein VFQ90_09975 [Stellaceae bacterium]|jgi:hypothetical protein|nr:hypothetical protein [Stellaceae bacterium]